MNSLMTLPTPNTYIKTYTHYYIYIHMYLAIANPKNEITCAVSIFDALDRICKGLGGEGGL